MKMPESPRPSDPVLQEYSLLAARYDTKWSFYIEATTRETLARLALRPSDRLLDVGCGTGALLHALAATHPPSLLAGVDPVPEMLAQARDRLGEAVNLRAGWAEDLRFPSECFDVVVSCNVFHYIRRPVTALNEMIRVLRPQGQLVITDWCDDYLACRLCDLYLRLRRGAHFRIYRVRECAQLLAETGQSVLSVERYKINWLWGLMTARVLKDAASLANAPTAAADRAA
jgi:ubiquinone/menaquinone biosynthesis C-methylase UbiE